MEAKLDWTARRIMGDTMVYKAVTPLALYWVSHCPGKRWEASRRTYRRKNDRRAVGCRTAREARAICEIWFNEEERS